MMLKLHMSINTWSNIIWLSFNTQSDFKTWSSMLSLHDDINIVLNLCLIEHQHFIRCLPEAWADVCSIIDNSPGWVSVFDQIFAWNTNRYPLKHRRVDISSNSDALCSSRHLLDHMLDWISVEYWYLANLNLVSVWVLTSLNTSSSIRFSKH